MSFTRPSLGDDLLQMTEMNFNARYIASNMDPIVQLTLTRSLGTLNQVFKELVGIKMPSIAKSVFEVSDWHELLTQWYTYRLLAHSEMPWPSSLRLCSFNRFFQGQLDTPDNQLCREDQRYPYCASCIQVCCERDPIYLVSFPYQGI